jgi:hypothetical protein
LSYKSCSEIISDTIASGSSIIYAPSEPAYITYYTVERATPEVAWRQSEPATVTYYYSYDSALNNALAAEYAGME